MDDRHANRNSIPQPQGNAAIRIEAEYHALTQACDHTELMAQIKRFLRALQFSDFAFTLKQTPNNPAYYFSTSPETYEFFQQLPDWEFDISAIYATPDNRPLYQSSIEKYMARAPFTTASMAKGRHLCAQVREQGFEELYHLPISLRDGGSALLTIAARNATYREFHTLVARQHTALEQLCTRIALTAPVLFATTQLQRQSPLGPTSLLLLNALAKENLSLNAAADSLCMSVSTANKHVAQIKKNLAAKTIASAVYKAAKMGLID